MKVVVLAAALVLALETSAGAFSYSTGGCADGCAAGEQWLHSNGNEIDTALDAIQTVNTTQTSDISSLTSSLANYLPLAGGTMTGSIVLSNSAEIEVGLGSVVYSTGGDVIATAMSGAGQIDNNDIADNAVDGGTGGEIQDGTITTADIADGTVTGTDILNDTVALTTDTAGDYVATITNSDGFITVSGTGTEGRAVTLALASTAATQQELDDKSAASSTVNNVAKFSSTTGDLVDSLLTVADTTGNVTTPGALSAGGSTGASTFTLRNMADSGWVECGVSGTTFTCAVDADGAPDGTL